MKLTRQIAGRLREVHLGDNWISSSLREKLEGITWQQATTNVYSFHSIATLVFHLNYYVSAVLKVFQGGPLDAHDKYSFDHPPIQSQADWENLLSKTWSDAESLANLVEQLPEDELWEDLAEAKYGDRYRNLQGIVEHCHYHLGQIALIRRIVLQKDNNSS